MAREDRQRTLDREHREHVAKLSAWPLRATARESGDFTVRIVNSSNEPFYNVVVFPVFIQGAAPHTGEEWTRLFQSRVEAGESTDWIPLPAIVGALLPGAWDVLFRKFDTGILSGRAGAEIACTDRAGTHWLRRAGGDLQELTVPATKHYGLWPPFDYATLQPVAG